MKIMQVKDFPYGFPHRFSHRFPVAPLARGPHRNLAQLTSVRLDVLRVCQGRCGAEQGGLTKDVW